MKSESMLRPPQKDIFQRLENITPDSPRTLLAHIATGAGKSGMAALAYTRLREQGVVEKLCIIAPTASLAEQGEEAFTSPWLAPFTNGARIRRACNEILPSRGCDGYMTTYQAIANDRSRINLYEMLRADYLVVLDELHHIAVGSSWAAALAPLVDAAKYRIYLSGTLGRHDQQRIAFLNYKTYEGVTNGNS